MAGYEFPRSTDYWYGQFERAGKEIIRLTRISEQQSKNLAQAMFEKNEALEKAYAKDRSEQYQKGVEAGKLANIEDKRYWRDRACSAESQLTVSRRLVDALQTQIIDREKHEAKLLNEAYRQILESITTPEEAIPAPKFEVGQWVRAFGTWRREKLHGYGKITARRWDPTYAGIPDKTGGWLYEDTYWHPNGGFGVLEDCFEPLTAEEEKLHGGK